MSISYQSKDDRVLAIQLKVQELCLSSADRIVSVSGADLLVSIGEPVESVHSALKVAADGTVTAVAKADQLIVDSSSPSLTTGDDKVIKLVGESLATGDVLVLRYVVAE